MPKGRTVRLFTRPSPYRRARAVGPAEDEKEWEEVQCPICMEHPHNAVLLKCSSHEKGCRPYLCDTSRRHSNCLNQFLKSSSSSGCPLCRGSILGHSASAPARAHLDRRPRSCSTVGCGFSGTYPELRQHARSDHPSARPAEVDPARQLDWTRLELSRDYHDVLSLAESSPPVEEYEATAATGSNNNNEDDHDILRSPEQISSLNGGDRLPSSSPSPALRLELDERFILSILSPYPVSYYCRNCRRFH